jgi:hypothetical protein
LFSPVREIDSLGGCKRVIEQETISVVCEEMMAVKGNCGNYAVLVYVAFVVDRRAYQAVAVTTYNLVRCFRRLSFLSLSSLVNCSD